MIYHFLHEHFNLVKYISFRASGAAITALMICFLIGPRIIRTLVKHQYGETIRKIGPKSHLEKEGTPSMGGIIILLSIILPTILWAKINNHFIFKIENSAGNPLVFNNFNYLCNHLRGVHKLTD